MLIALVPIKYSLFKPANFNPHLILTKNENSRIVNEKMHKTHDVINVLDRSMEKQSEVVAYLGYNRTTRK